MSEVSEVMRQHEAGEGMQKYVAKALEGYEQNYEGISQAISKMEEQLVGYKEQQAEIKDGITEMKGLLGLSEEDTELKVVNDGTAIE